MMPCDVLIVDDNPDNVRLLALELEAAGLTVHSAHSGEECLAHLELHLPDAIFLDVVMPGLNGFETCEIIRQRSAELPIIFMTGRGETEDVVHGFAVGGTDYVTKPISPAQVFARLKAHTRVASLVRATREGINAAELPMLAVDQHQQLLWCNLVARQLITQCAPHLLLQEGQALPNDLITLLPKLESDTDSPALALPSGQLRMRRISEPSQSITVLALHLAPDAGPAPIWLPPQLTARESEVLLWVARGKTNRDIADILGMSPRTVNKHLEHIFEKLGVETRTAAAAVAQSLKLANIPN